MHDNFYYDVKEIGNELSRHKSKYRQLEDRYNEMSDDEKSDYVVLIFNNIIDNSDEFTDEEKEYLKEREGRLLKEYGHYYYFDSIFNMIYRLRRVKIERDVEMDSGIDGQYNNIKNLISISKGGDMDVLGHEVEHAITINYAEFNMLNEYGLTYMFEAIDSSTDLEYYDSYSYNSIMRNHMLFLSKVIGKDNLLRIYLNGDLKLLKKLLGKDCNELIQLFGEQYKIFKSNGYDNKHCDKIADKLKYIYEEKNNCLIEDDEQMMAIYEGCKSDSDIYIYPNLFSDFVISNYFNKDEQDKEYSDRFKATFFDGECEGIINYNFNSSFNVKKKELFRKNSEFFDRDLSLEKMNYFLPEDVMENVAYISKPYFHLKLYLDELGVSNSDYWAYNILNNSYPVFCSSDIFYYDEKSFNDDLKIILDNKYKELEKEGKLYELYDGFDVFFYDVGNVSEDVFKNFWNGLLKHDEESFVNIINSSKMISNSKSGKKK